VETNAFIGSYLMNRPSVTWPRGLLVLDRSGLSFRHAHGVFLFCEFPFLPTSLALYSLIAGYWQARCLETGESVAIKKVLQDRRYKNRELQLMRLFDHPNVISLKHCFFSTTSKDELFLNLVMEYVPESLSRVLKHYSSMNQRMPLIYVKLYTYQV